MWIRQSFIFWLLPANPHILNACPIVQIINTICMLFIFLWSLKLPRQNLYCNWDNYHSSYAHDCVRKRDKCCVNFYMNQIKRFKVLEKSQWKTKQKNTHTYTHQQYHKSPSAYLSIGLQTWTTGPDMKAVPHSHDTCHSQEHAFKKPSTENHKRCYHACTQHFTVKGTKSRVTKQNKNHSALYCGIRHYSGICISTISNM